MDLQTPNLLNKYIFLHNLFQTINIFASSQSYAMVKKRIKVGKKEF